MFIYPGAPRFRKRIGVHPYVVMLTGVSLHVVEYAARTCTPCGGQS